ncbi:hypothetical protein JHK86_016565 [Glycine max]|nr:hypothetical protein JHK86_016565 [Glycine max]
MESHFATLSKLICLGPVNDDVRVVGITGMGGIGKSTLGEALYERISHQFNSRCYIDDVSKLYKREGKSGVQKQLLSQSLNERNLEIFNVCEGTLQAWKRLSNAKAFIVLDNVNQNKQLDMFTGGRGDLLHKRLGRGSIVIIISRDKQILKTYGVDLIYQVKPLNYNHAVRLFCKKAFKNNYIMSDFETLTSNVLSHCQGHPLAIEVLGSSLFDRNVSYWRKALVSLRESKSIMDVLRISFDQLEDTHKEIFLDIACFLYDYGVEYVKEILDFREFNPEYGLQVLVDKSLITMDEKIEMHDVLRDLGKYIVREKSPRKPWKWSRLWDFKDLDKVSSDNKTAENVEVIVPEEDYDLEEDSDLEDSDLEDSHFLPTVRVDALSTMSNLKVLTFGYWNADFEINYSGTLAKLSNELGYLTWVKYPFECLPPSFEPDKLVELIMPDSNIKQLWEDTKPLPNLRRLCLFGSKNLIKMPYIGDALYLERFDLQGCIQLEEIGLSIVLSPKLPSLNLRNCKSLIKLPRFGEDLILEQLVLEGCQKLRHIDPSIGLLKRLKYLNLKNCKNLVSLPNSILGLNSLEHLNLSGCSKLYNTELLYELRDAGQLKKIDIDGAPIHFQSTSSNSREHKKSVSCSMPSSPIFPCMRKLDLSFCNLVEIPDAIGVMSCLQWLDLSGNNFATLPNLKKLSKLHCLKLHHCKQLKSLPELPSRAVGPELYMFNCPELVDRERCIGMAFSWMMQLFQVPYGDDSHIFKSVIPGSEIPRWLNNEHEGNCVSLDASPVMHDHNWIGVAFCAIFVVPHETLSAMGVSGPDRRYYGTYCRIPVDFYGDLDLELVLDKSDHMWLFYVDRKEFIDEFHLKDNYIGRLILKYDDEGIESKVSHAKVKKYGYRWVYKGDIESLGRKRKFGEIEENEVKRKKGIMSAEGRKDDASSSQENTINLNVRV